MKKKLIVVYGPTASGKTSLALNLAKEKNGALINADSRQVYKYMDIGTNKEYDKHVSEKNHAYLDEIPIYLINILTPDKQYSVADYKKDALDAIKQIEKSKRIPILVGGTGLYLDALLKNYNLENDGVDGQLRHSLNKLSKTELQEMLEELDSKKLASMNNSDRNNPRRLIRAIEKIKLVTNKVEAVNKSPLDDYDIEYHQPNYTIAALYEKIDRRVVDMLTQGLIGEVKHLLELGYTRDLPIMQTMGYREVIQYLEMKITMPEMIKAIQQSHRNYAKKQITWFKKYIDNKL